MSLLVVLSMTTEERHTDRLEDLLAEMMANAARHGALRQELARTTAGAAGAIVVAIWPDRHTYDAFQHSDAHARLSAGIRTLGPATAMHLGELCDGRPPGGSRDAPPADEAREAPPADTARSPRADSPENLENLGNRQKGDTP